MKKVRFVAAGGCQFTPGAIYEVEKESKTPTGFHTYFIKGVDCKPYGFLTLYFEDVMKKVQWIGPPRHPTFKDGQSYEVEREGIVDDKSSAYHGTPTYYIKGVNNYTFGYFQHAFKVVSEESEQSEVAKTIPVAANKVPTIDLDEERLWQMMRPRIEAGHCACGVVRAMCDYHKD